MEHTFFLFSLEGRRYAIHLQAVDRVIPAVEITPAPDQSDFLLGFINLQGLIIPVINIRKKLALFERQIDIDDTLVIVHLLEWTVAFAVDSVEGVINRSDQEIIFSRDIVPLFDVTEGVVKIDNDMVLIYAIDRLLSGEEKEQLQEL